MTLRNDFSDSFPNQAFGRITGTFGMSQFPNQPAALARLKANANNTSPIWIGSMVNSGSFPLCWELGAGEDTGWFSSSNLNSLWQNASSGSCYLSYWVQY